MSRHHAGCAVTVGWPCAPAAACTCGADRPAASGFPPQVAEPVPIGSAIEYVGQPGSRGIVKSATRDLATGEWSYVCDFSPSVEARTAAGDSASPSGEYSISLGPTRGRLVRLAPSEPARQAFVFEASQRAELEDLGGRVIQIAGVQPGCDRIIVEFLVATIGPDGEVQP